MLKQACWKLASWEMCWLSRSGRGWEGCRGSLNWMNPVLKPSFRSGAVFVGSRLEGGNVRWSEWAIKAEREGERTFLAKLEYIPCYLPKHFRIVSRYLNQPRSLDRLVHIRRYSHRHSVTSLRQSHSWRNSLRSQRDQLAVEVASMDDSPDIVNIISTCFSRPWFVMKRKPTEDKDSLTASASDWGVGHFERSMTGTLSLDMMWWASKQVFSEVEWDVRERELNRSTTSTSWLSTIHYDSFDLFTIIHECPESPQVIPTRAYSQWR